MEIELTEELKKKAAAEAEAKSKEDIKSSYEYDA